MKAIRFDSGKHLEQVQQWCRAWNMTEFQDGWLPTVGFIVPGIACAWLYITDSELAMMENVIANPESDPTNRGLALDKITEAIFRTAKECGAKWVMGASNIQPVIDRATNVHGFIKVEQPVHQLLKVLD